MADTRTAPERGCPHPQHAKPPPAAMHPTARHRPDALRVRTPALPPSAVAPSRFREAAMRQGRLSRLHFATVSPPCEGREAKPTASKRHRHQTRHPHRRARLVCLRAGTASPAETQSCVWGYTSAPNGKRQSLRSLSRNADGSSLRLGPLSSQTVFGRIRRLDPTMKFLRYIAAVFGFWMGWVGVAILVGLLITRSFPGPASDHNVLGDWRSWPGGLLGVVAGYWLFRLLAGHRERTGAR